MAEPMPFKSPHIQEALPDLIELAKKARETCNDRKLAFVSIVHDADAVDSYVSSNISQEHALSLIQLTAGTGHGAPHPIK